MLMSLTSILSTIVSLFCPFSLSFSFTITFSWFISWLITRTRWTSCTILPFLPFLLSLFIFFSFSLLLLLVIMISWSFKPLDLTIFPSWWWFSLPWRFGEVKSNSNSHRIYCSCGQVFSKIFNVQFLHADLRSRLYTIYESFITTITQSHSNSISIYPSRPPTTMNIRFNLFWWFSLHYKFNLWKI